MVNHSLWHQRTGAGREPVCPICGNIVQFAFDEIFRASWVCYLGHKIIAPVYAGETACPFSELHSV